ncbi:hypothetical protein LSAT2_004475 [Lamellibrachia satsuma]|nr:hypothetical protein LSAT2_004475 [Lamellibrachia satsuma]
MCFFVEQPYAYWAGCDQYKLSQLASFVTTVTCVVQFVDPMIGAAVLAMPKSPLLDGNCGDRTERQRRRHHEQLKSLRRYQFDGC